MNWNNTLSIDGPTLKREFHAHLHGANYFEGIAFGESAGFPLWPVLCNEDPGTFRWFQWGMAPSWNQKEHRPIHHRFSLSVPIQRAFSVPFIAECLRDKRCLIPSTGFFFWYHLNRKRYPYLLQVKNQPLFSMAGVWSNWTNPITYNNEYTFSILTRRVDLTGLPGRQTPLRVQLPIVLSGNNRWEWLLDGLSVANIKQVSLNPDTAWTYHTVRRDYLEDPVHQQMPYSRDHYEYPELNQPAQPGARPA